MKKLMVLVLVLGLQLECFSQLSPYQWRFGISGGITNYYGDLSPYTLSTFSENSNFFKLYEYNKNYIPEHSFSLHLEKSLSPTVGTFLTAGRHFISMSDRYVDKEGVLQLDAPNFERALNFKTEILDMGLGLVFKTDNGKFLKQNAFFAPYFNLGVGWLNYKVYGDLYDENGNPYDYGRLEKINDRVFETRLDRLNTELQEGYENHAFYGQLGLGFRLRVTRELELFAQSDFRYTNTDYLDDVSGEYRLQYDSPQQNYAAKPGNNIIDLENPYRGNEDGRNDWYINHSIGIKLSFVPHKISFRASRVSPGNYQVTARKSEIAEQQEIADSLSSIETTRPTNNYITFIQLYKPYNQDSSNYFLKILESDLNILKWEKSLEENENLLSLLNSQMDSLEETRERWSMNPPEEIISDQERALLQQDIGKVALQIEEATINGNNIKKELESSRQNKELYQTAYEKSILNPRKTDSLQFFNEILELPAAVSQALFNRGPWYTSTPDGPVNSVLAPEQSPSAWSSRVGMTTDSIASSKTGQDELSGLRADLMQERARSNYLLRELSNYSGTQIYQSYPPRPSSPDEIQENAENRNVRRQQEYYPFPDQRYSDGLRRQGYVLPPVLLDTRARSRDSSGDYSLSTQGLYQNRGGRYPNPSPGIGLEERNGAKPLSLREMARLNQLSQLGIPFDFSLNTNRTRPISVLANQRQRTRTDTVYVENQPSDILFNNKVDIYFDNNQAKPSEKEYIKLNTLYKSLENNPNWGLYITGFADNTGNLKYNLNLIDRRMEQIQSFFVQEKGVSPDRIRMSSGGLIIRGSNRKSSPIDRKVEIWIQENEE